MLAHDCRGQLAQDAVGRSRLRCLPSINESEDTTVFEDSTDREEQLKSQIAGRDFRRPLAGGWGSGSRRV